MKFTIEVPQQDSFYTLLVPSELCTEDALEKLHCVFDMHEFFLSPIENKPGFQALCYWPKGAWTVSRIHSKYIFKVLGAGLEEAEE